MISLSSFNIKLFNLIDILHLLITPFWLMTHLQQINNKLLSIVLLMNIKVNA